MGDFRVEYFGVLRGCENERNLETEESAIERLRLWVKMLKPYCYNRESVTLGYGFYGQRTPTKLLVSKIRSDMWVSAKGRPKLPFAGDGQGEALPTALGSGG